MLQGVISFYKINDNIPDILLLFITTLAVTGEMQRKGWGLQQQLQDYAEDFSCLL